MEISKIVQSADQPASMCETGMQKAMEAPKAIATAAFEVGAEVTRFWSSRIKAQADIIETLARCKTGSDVSATHKQFLEQAARQYSAEITQIMDLAQKCMQRTVDVMVFPNTSGQARAA